MISSIILIAFTVLTLFMAFAWFYLFVKSREKFIQFCGLSWLAYSASLFCLFLSFSNDVVPLNEIRIIFDMINILMLLFSIYSFTQIRIPAYWYRFTMYLVLWFVIGLNYYFDLMSVYLPVSLFMVICTSRILYIIIRHWQVSPIEKILALMAFGIWGIGKAILAIWETQTNMSSSITFMEIIFSNILSFSIFVIYIQRAIERVSIAEKTFKVIAENTPDIIFYYSLKPRPAFTYITPSVEFMTGYSANNFYSDPKFYMELAPPEDFDKFRHFFEPSMEDVDEDSRMVFQLIHKNGSTIWAEMKTSIICENGVPLAVEGTIRDISMMKNAENNMIASKESKDKLLSYISHELRIPIASIMGYIVAIKDGTVTTESERLKAFDIIYNKATTLNNLIRDLFQLSKLEAKQLSLNMDMVDAMEMTNMLLKNHTEEVRDSGFTLEIHIDKDNLNDKILIVDTERINQVLTNLISNAKKSSEADKYIMLSFESDRKKEYYSVTVEDHGTGIDELDIPKIFDRFYKKDSGNESSSSGLGLTLSKELIEAHKGRMSVDSDLGKGSQFTFEIPFYVEKDGD